MIANDFSFLSFRFFVNQFIPAGAVTQILQKMMIVVGPQKTKVQNTP